MDAVRAGSSECPNCGVELRGRYCFECGQKVGPLNPSAHDFLHELAHEFLHFDGKIVRSVRLLLTRPGFLTREQFEGRRQRYVSPIRLYLVFSVAYFAIAVFAPSAGVRVTFAPGPNDSAEEIQRAMERLPEAQKAASEALSHWVPRVLFVLVPFFALLVAQIRRTQTLRPKLPAAPVLRAASACGVVLRGCSGCRRADQDGSDRHELGGVAVWRLRDCVLLAGPAARVHPVIDERRIPRSRRWHRLPTARGGCADPDCAAGGATN